MQISPRDCQNLLTRPSGLACMLWEPSSPPVWPTMSPRFGEGNAKQAETQALPWLPAAEIYWMAPPMELMHHLRELHHCFFLPKDGGREEANLLMSSDKKLGQVLREFAKQQDIFLSRVQFACCCQRRGKLLKGIKNASKTIKPLKSSVFRKMSCSHLHHPAVAVSHVWSHLARVHTGCQEQGFSVLLYQVTP